MPSHPATVPSPVLEVGQFNRALVGYSCRAPKIVDGSNTAIMQIPAQKTGFGNNRDGIS